MNKFKIAGTELSAVDIVTDELTIQSFPKPYEVSFKKQVQRGSSCLS